MSGDYVSVNGALANLAAMFPRSTLYTPTGPITLGIGHILAPYTVGGTYNGASYRAQSLPGVSPSKATYMSLGDMLRSWGIDKRPPIDR